MRRLGPYLLEILLTSKTFEHCHFHVSHCPPIGSNTFAEDVLDRLRGWDPEAGRQAEAGPAAARQGHLGEE